jgi:hypothetical protein
MPWLANPQMTSACDFSKQWIIDNIRGPIRKCLGWCYDSNSTELIRMMGWSPEVRTLLLGHTYSRGSNTTGSTSRTLLWRSKKVGVSFRVFKYFTVQGAFNSMERVTKFLKKISSASAHSCKLAATVMQCAFCCTVSRHGLNFADTLVVLKRSIMVAWHTSQKNSLLLSYFPDNYSLIWSHQITHFCYKLFTSARRTSRPLVTFCHISTNIHTSSRRRNNSKLRTAHCLLSHVRPTVFSRNAVLNL